jgi:hypothetical protein
MLPRRLSVRRSFAAAFLTAALGAASCSSTASSVDGGGQGGASGSDGGRVDAAALDRGVTVGSPCETPDDCASTPAFSLFCEAPGEFPGCGNCRQGTDECTADTDCAADAGPLPGVAPGVLICEVAPSSECFCVATVRVCQIGCRTGADCPAGSDCNVTIHECQTTCGRDGSCPINFACTAGNLCQRNSCQTDRDCSSNCVKGRCYDAPGVCVQRPA